MYWGNGTRGGNVRPLIRCEMFWGVTSFGGIREYRFYPVEYWIAYVSSLILSYNNLVLSSFRWYQLTINSLQTANIQAARETQCQLTHMIGSNRNVELRSRWCQHPSVDINIFKWPPFPSMTLFDDVSLWDRSILRWCPSVVYPSVYLWSDTILRWYS